MSGEAEGARDAAAADPGDAGDEVVRVHLLDLGDEEYGDAVLCELGRVRIMIDGGHPSNAESDPNTGYRSIPEQLSELLGESPPHRIDLLVITHAHQDHIGCLPALVSGDVIRPRWTLAVDHRLGWGQPVAGGDAAPAAVDGSRAEDAATAALVRRHVAALREEPLDARASDGRIERFLDAADALEGQYGELLADLRGRGADKAAVVEYGRDALDPIERAFRRVKLRVLGPSEHQLLLAAEAILTGTQHVMDHVRRRLHDFVEAGGSGALDTATNGPALYRALRAEVLEDGARLAWDLTPSPEAEAANGDADAVLADAVKRAGSAINLQSIVLSLEYAGVRLLFGGDMELAHPAVKGIDDDVSDLRAAIREGAPYDFVKLLHHGSRTATDDEWLDRELTGTANYGICGGWASRKLPDNETLDRLKARRRRITWARTDRNGRVTFTFGPEGPHVEKERGRLNDWHSNADAPPERPEKTASSEASTPIEPTPKERSVGEERSGAAEACAGTVELIARVPHEATRVTVTIDVAPAMRGGAGPTGARRAVAGRSAELSGDGEGVRRLAALRLGGPDREVPRLLFVTSREALAGNIGALECEYALRVIRAADMHLLETLPAGMIEAPQAAPYVQDELRRLRAGGARIEGVVLLGGHDVVPAQRLDALPDRLRQVVQSDDDLDDFYVWSDDVYADLEGDDLPELPVSRIPDGKDALLVAAALGAAPPGQSPGATRAGVHNAERPFARAVFEGIPGSGALLASQPTMAADMRPEQVAAARLYLMLHGSLTDATRFYGERRGRMLEAVNLASVPARFDGVVFSGCCWGALTVNRSARYAVPGQLPAPRNTRNSLALAFLAAGAQAFVGCTAVHYSPEDAAGDSFGGPMHKAFWARHGAGAPPAQALFEAKADYARFIARQGERNSVTQAIEFKLWRQYTCLGLGW